MSQQKIAPQASPRNGLRHSITSLALLALAAACVAQTAAPEDLTRFPRATLLIESGRWRHAFDIWIADTPARQEQGLMFVRDLPANRGMLFPQTEPRPMSMWMKNTYIPLDMLFIDSSQRVVKIAAQAEPHSLTTISAGQAVAAVLELEGGEAARLGLRIGDRVSWKLK